MHRGYTINYFVETISAISNTQITKNFYKALATRDGFNSCKAEALDVFLGDPYGVGTLELLAGTTDRSKMLGKTPKTRLLRALKIRKKTGVSPVACA